MGSYGFSFCFCLSCVLFTVYAIIITGIFYILLIENQGEKLKLGMVEFLTNPVFKYGILPIGSAMLGIAVKYASRNDQYAKFRKEDIAVGLDLTLTACLMFVVLTTDRAAKLLIANRGLADLLNRHPLDTVVAAELQAKSQLLSSQIASSGWVIALMFLGLGGLSTTVRKWGWNSETEMNPIMGIAIPLIFGIAAIIGVMAGAAQ
ncbi:MAG: hypothetical protein AB1611_04815 [bacterium]